MSVSEEIFFVVDSWKLTIFVLDAFHLSLLILNHWLISLINSCAILIRSDEIFPL